MHKRIVNYTVLRIAPSATHSNFVDPVADDERIRKLIQRGWEVLKIENRHVDDAYWHVHMALRDCMPVRVRIEIEWLCRANAKWRDVGQPRFDEWIRTLLNDPEAVIAEKTANSAEVILSSDNETMAFTRFVSLVKGQECEGGHFCVTGVRRC